MKTVFAKSNEKLNLVGKLSDDKIELFLDAERLTAGVVTHEELLALIADGVKAELLDTAVLDDIAKHLSKGEKIQERRIAKGKEAETGADGKLLLLVKKFTGQVETKVDQKGFANYSDLNLFENIKTGQVIARLYPPKEGISGVTALGEVISAKAGKPLKPAVDKSLTLQASSNAEDPFQVFVAQCDGYLAEDAGKLLIKTELVIEGDLDYRFGNVDFIGKVIIKGDSNPEFIVKAQKGIEVRGCVNSTTLISPDGDIQIKGLVSGGKGAKIIAGKNLIFDHAQEIDAEVRGNISIEKLATDCKLRSASLVIMPRAELIKGHTWVARGLEAKNIGNSAGVATLVHLCSEVETTREYEQLALEIESHDKAVQLIELHLGPYVKNPSRIQVLKEPLRGKMEKLFAKHQSVQKSRESLLEKKTLMLAGGSTVEVIRVNVLGSMYDGAAVRAAEASFASHEEITGPKSLDYIVAEKKFEMGEYKALPGIDQAKESQGEKDGKGKR